MDKEIDSDGDCVVITTVPRTKLLDKTFDISDDDGNDFDVGYSIDTRPHSDESSTSKQIRNPFYLGNGKERNDKRKSKKTKNKKSKKIECQATSHDLGEKCSKKRKKDCEMVEQNVNTCIKVKKSKKHKPIGRGG